MLQVAPARTGTLVMSCAAALVGLMGLSGPATIVPQTAAGLGGGATAPVWIVNALNLGLMGLLLVAGGLADDFGRRRMYLIGITGFAVSTAVAALSTNLATFVVARLVQGGAIAAILAASLGILGHAYPAGPGRGSATRFYGSSVGLSVVLGPPLAALVMPLTGWRGVYWVLAGLAVLVGAAAWRLVPESRAKARRRVDLGGLLTLVAGLAALAVGVTEGRYGWGQPVVIASFVAAVVLLAAFVAIERRHREPLLDLELFRRPLFLVSLGGSLVTGIVIVGLMTYLASLLQLAGRLTIGGTAVFLAYWAIVAFLSSLLAGRIKLTSRGQFTLAMVFGAAGILLFYGLVERWSVPQAALAATMLGIAYGLANSSLSLLAIESVPQHRVSMGAGAGSTARYLGSALGIAVMSVLVGGNGQADGADISILAFAVLAMLTAMAVPLAAKLMTSRRG